MEETIVVIDGNSLINRAYYAIQRPMVTREGVYTQGIYGFLNMLQKILTDYEPERLAVAFDRKAPTFRHLEYAEYKAGRKKMPPELAMQLLLLKEILEAMHIPVLEIDGFEADDIIGTVARRAEEAGLRTLIITGDRDELQLATDKVSVVLTKKGISEFELYDRNAMMEKYGFTPEQFIDFKGLMGDASDNIPGIPGVGEKTAQKLILEFGSVEGLVRNAEAISNEKLRAKVKENAQVALMSRRLAEIETNVPLEIDLEACRRQEPDNHQLIELYKRLEFNSFLKKLKVSGPGSGGPLPGAGSGTGPLVPEVTEQLTISRTEELRALEEALDRAETAVLKVFGNGDHRKAPQISGVSLLIGGRYFFLKPEGPGFLPALAELLASCKAGFIGHHLQEDYYALYCQGLSSWVPETAFDTALAQYVLEPTRSSYRLEDMVRERFHRELTGQEAETDKEGQLGFFQEQEPDRAALGLAWCLAVLELQGVLEAEVKEEELDALLRQVELPLAAVLASMEARGFSVDRGELERAGEAIGARLEELSRRVFALAGEEFNLNSPKQLGEILFEKMKLPAGKKTKTAGYSTNAEVLDKLKDDYEIVALILEYRTLAKLKGTYIDGLIPLIGEDEKIRAHFQQTVTATGRISCTEPNLQNIPIRQEPGRSLRKAFVPEGKDLILVGADYSQIELRVLAHMSGDESLIEAFNQGQDIHRATAARVFGVEPEAVSSLQRSNAKAVNFGVIYGMSGFGLSEELQISRRDAEQYIEEYFRRYPRVKGFMEEQVALCRERGYVTTIFGRRRRIPEINGSNYMQRQAAERLAMNSPIQGSAADVIKLAMTAVFRRLAQEGLRSRLILQIHDELIIETYRDELEQVKALLTESMEEAAALQVRLAVDLNQGENWYELK
ncbi:MAG: DNA polymerase I [Bacillota bacterium]|nr:DNA polymerase I [Bacillota bacterium]